MPTDDTKRPAGRPLGTPIGGPIDVPLPGPVRPGRIPPGDPLPIDIPMVTGVLSACDVRRLHANAELVAGPNHWWQNWPKTHAYVAQKMFFPTNVDELAAAITRAEADARPVRAAGGGWSFSDAVLPGAVTTLRPNVYAVEALSEVVPLAESFDLDRSHAMTASISDTSLVPDVADSLTMIGELPFGVKVIDGDWSYKGAGTWWWKGQPYATNAMFLPNIQAASRRPVRIRDHGALAGKSAAEIEDIIRRDDTPGSLVMFDLKTSTTAASRDWFYHGDGVWSVGVSTGGGKPEQGTLENLTYTNRLLYTTAGGNLELSPRASKPGAGLELLLSKKPEAVYLINTRQMVSSLQQGLPRILSTHAVAVTSPELSGKRRHLFHVEAGITIEELGVLLSHQSPRLSLQAVSGSPGATLAGALATGTHGAEFNWPTVIDSVKAVHLVGPGGVQWWIEGNESIADPARLVEVYSCLAPEHIVTAASSPAVLQGIEAQDWLNAVVVSLGCMGVLYSMVLEVVPQFGVHEVVVQNRWLDILRTVEPPPVGSAAVPALASLRSWPSQAARDTSTKIVTHLQDGARSGTLIGIAKNQYADLAFNPNALLPDNYDTWIGNREVVPRMPVESQPGTSAIAGVTRALAPRPTSGNVPRDHLQAKLKNVYGFGSTLDLVGNLLTYSSAGPRLRRLLSAADVFDVGLDSALTPMITAADGPELTQAILTGLLAGLLGTVDGGRSDLTGVSVGALGFPADGLMGAGIEIALPPAEAFGFLQVEILDKLNPPGVVPLKPFFGYISIRLCSRSQALIGMAQWGGPCSVMIEVVAFATPESRTFLTALQQRTLARIDGGLDAMLHWGLENEQVTSVHLSKIPALQAKSASRGAAGAPGTTLTKLEAFRAVRSLLEAAAPVPMGTLRVFDNATTKRLGFEIDARPVIEIHATPPNCQAGAPITVTWKVTCGDSVNLRYESVATSAVVWSKPVAATGSTTTTALPAGGPDVRLVVSASSMPRGNNGGAHAEARVHIF